MNETRCILNFYFLLEMYPSIKTVNIFLIYLFVNSQIAECGHAYARLGFID